MGHDGILESRIRRGLVPVVGKYGHSRALVRLFIGYRVVYMVIKQFILPLFILCVFHFSRHAGLDLDAVPLLDQLA